MLCAYVKCVKQRREKSIYCSDRCTYKMQNKNNQKMYKNVFNNTGGIKAMSGSSSIKHDEIFGGVNMIFGTLDDYPIDQDILNVAIHNHDLQQEAKIEHELLVIYDGFEQLQLSHKEHCGVGLATASYRRLKEKNDKKYKERLESHKYAQWKQNDKRKNKKTNS